MLQVVRMTSLERIVNLPAYARMRLYVMMYQDSVCVLLVGLVETVLNRVQITGMSHD